MLPRESWRPGFDSIQYFTFAESEKLRQANLGEAKRDTTFLLEEADAAS